MHGTPARLMRAVKEATPGVWGVLLQFPFYAGVAAVIAKTHLNEQIAAWFVGISTKTTFPALIALYSAALGFFVPSGGSKWVIEAPYVMQAAHQLKVHLGWMVAVYDLGEALANLVQPFWMLPILGLFGLRARDVMGHTFLVFVVLLPVVLVLVTVLGMTLAYPLYVVSAPRTALCRRVGRRQVLPRRRGIRLEPHDRLELADRLVEFLLREQDVAEVVVRIRVGGIDLQRLAVLAVASSSRRATVSAVARL